MIKIKNLNTIIGFIAAGILTLTIGFRQSGDLWATIFLVIAGILTAIGCIKLIQSRVVVPLSYSGIAMVTYGRWLKILTDVAIVVSQTGFVTAYISFISIHVNAVACWALHKAGQD